MNFDMEAIDEQLWNFLDGNISEEERAEIEKLIHSNVQIREKLEEIMIFNRLLSSSFYLNNTKLSHNFESKLMDLININEHHESKMSISHKALIFIFCPPIIFIFCGSILFGKALSTMYIFTRITLSYCTLIMFIVIMVALFLFVIKFMEFKLKRNNYFI